MTVDRWLHERASLLGADVTVAVSIAFARAAARSLGSSFVTYIASLAGTRPAFPGLLAAAVSGGVHGHGLPFQQIMLATAAGRPSETVPAVLAVYERIEEEMLDRRYATGLSSSSGLTVNSAGAAAAFDIVSQAIVDTGMEDAITIAVDVAAEHLWGEGGYRLGGTAISGADFMHYIVDIADRYPVAVVEDPFDASDREHWKQLTGSLGGRVVVVGDDLFATNSDYIDSALADAVLLKLNQNGTLTGTLSAAARAKKAGMERAVSHRSLETDDTAICDLAVGLAARWLKIGGPRRGDRVAKYNRLLRLERDADASREKA